MDTSSIDQAYGQLQAEFQDVAKSVQTLAEKLQAAAQGGDTNAREWLLDLKQIALDVKDEQIQATGLLQEIHRWADDSHSSFSSRCSSCPRRRSSRCPRATGAAGADCSAACSAAGSVGRWRWAQGSVWART